LENLEKKRSLKSNKKERRGREKKEGPEPEGKNSWHRETGTRGG